MASIQALPEDVLFLIFLHALPAIIGDTPAFEAQVLPPFNFSLVCSAWRAVVLSHPRLWGLIDITYDPDHPNHLTIAHVVRSFLTEWLRRSGSAPLNLSLSLFWPDGNRVARELLDMVLHENRRWNNVYLMLYGVRKLDEKPATIKCLPSINSFTLLCGRKFPAELDLSSCMIARNGGFESQLRALRVTPHMRWVFPECRGDLHLPNLRTVVFNVVDVGASLEDTLSFLRACPSLSSLTITIQRVSKNPLSRATELLHLPSLRHLTIHSTNRVITLRLLDHLSCPSLQTFMYLALNDQEKVNKEPWEERETVFTSQHLLTLSTFFSRSCSQNGVYASLTSFSIYFDNSPIPRKVHAEFIAVLTRLLRLFIGLEDLRLTVSVIDGDFIRSLALYSGTDGGENTEPENSSTLCRPLQSISIGCAEAPGLRKETLEDMIESRRSMKERDADARLQLVLLTIPGFEEFGIESERMKKCVEEGLELHCR